MRNGLGTQARRNRVVRSCRCSREGIGVGNGVCSEGSVGCLHDEGFGFFVDGYHSALVADIESEAAGAIGRHHGVGAFENEHAGEACGLGFGGEAQTGGRPADDDQIKSLEVADHGATLVFPDPASGSDTFLRPSAPVLLEAHGVPTQGKGLRRIRAPTGAAQSRSIHRPGWPIE